MDLVAWGLAFALASGTGASSPPQAAPPGGTPTFTLEAALAQARTAGPVVAAARARAAGAREAADRTTRWLNPVLELRTENWGSSQDLPLDTFVLLTQPLEISGSRGARLGLATADRVETDAMAREVEQQTMREVARGYLEGLRLRETLAVVGEQRDGLREIVRALERRVAEGVAADADLRKFEAELAQVETEALRLDLDLTRALNDLFARLALAPLTAGQLVMPPVPPSAASPAEAELVQLLEARPDVARARARLERAERAADVERARGRPDLLVSGGYKRTSEANTGVVAVMLPIPLADRNAASVARATADARASALELEQVRALARAEAFALVSRAQALSAGANRLTRTLVEPATVVRQAARASFREGAFDALRLVDAERVWTDARRAQLALHLDAVLASIEARLALGQEVVP